jgi:hypothetical protein
MTRITSSLWLERGELASTCVNIFQTDRCADGLIYGQQQDPRCVAEKIDILYAELSVLRR